METHCEISINGNSLDVLQADHHHLSYLVLLVDLLFSFQGSLFFSFRQFGRNVSIASSTTPCQPFSAMF